MVAKLKGVLRAGFLFDKSADVEILAAEPRYFAKSLAETQIYLRLSHQPKKQKLCFSRHALIPFVCAQGGIPLQSAA